MNVIWQRVCNRVGMELLASKERICACANYHVATDKKAFEEERSHADTFRVLLDVAEEQRGLNRAAIPIGESWSDG